VRCQYFGKLQTNKIKKIVSRFDTLESVASKREIDFLVKYKDQLPFDTKTFFLEVNIGKEAQKNGVPLEQVDHLLGYATTKDLKISGLMTIPPKWEDPVPFFKQLRKLADQLGLESCQMGFSADYPQAIDCGATHIRIGRLIFEGLVK
jgi:uncharacterized pyridoxal phosphate-containing UPF0001 family protein